MPTREEVLAATKRRAVLKAIEDRAAALPLPVAGEEVPTFAGRVPDTVKETAELDAALEASRQRLETPDSAGTIMEAERLRMEQARRGSTTFLTAGSDKATTEDTSFMLAPFRPSRIRELAPAETSAGAPGSAAAMSDAQLGQAILATGDENLLRLLSRERDRREKEQRAQLRATPTAQVQAMEAAPGVQPEGERVYLDPASGKQVKPTAFQEMIESYALQPIMSEAAARQASERIQTSRKEIDRRIAKGEDVPFYEFAGPAFSGILSTRDETGAGTVETPLGAALRGGLGTLSALAAEGYFRGLGYEVDASGVPKDPEDLGLAIAKIRKAVGLPDVFEPTQVIPLTAAAHFVQRNIKGIAPEAAATLGNALAAIPQLAIPLPGVATQGTERKATEFDPEGRRRVSGIEVPSLLDDPRGFVEAETRRLARNVAAGRTFADEFFDSPATRQWYANVYGDEDAAFWAGSIGEIAIPAGPGTAARALGKTVGAVSKSAAAASVGKTVINAAETARAVPGFVARGTQAILDPVANVAAAVTRGEVADGRLVRRLANKTLDSMNIESGRRAAAKAAIKGSSNTLEDVVDDIGAVLDPTYTRPWAKAGATDEAAGGAARLLTSEVSYLYSTLRKNIPGDMVLITGNVAVPRALAPEWNKRAKDIRQNAFQRTNGDLRNLLQGRMNDLVGETSDAADLEYEALERILAKLGADGAYPTPKERAVLDRMYDALLKDFAPELTERADLTGRSISELVTLLGDSPLAARLAAVDAGLPARAPFPKGDGLYAAIADEVVNRELLRAIPKEARFTRDLTAAQVALRDLDYAVLDNDFARRIIAATMPLRGDSIATALTAREITAASQALLRNFGKELIETSQRAGSVDTALDMMVRTKLRGVPVEEQWIKALEGIYGNPEMAKAVRANALADAGNLPDSARWISESGFTSPPTVETLKAVDRLYAQGGKFGPGRNFVTDLPVLRILTPDYHKALIKVIVEEGLRKDLLARGKFKGSLDVGLDVAKGEVARVTDALKEATLDPALAKVEIPLPDGDVVRLRVYDPAASNFERLLSESGEGLFKLAESISPRIRGDLVQMAQDAVSWGFASFGRNMRTMGKYGYVLPNLPFIAAEAITPALISLATLGVRKTGRAVDYALFGRRMIGGGLYTKGGMYLTPSDLRQLADASGLGMSAVESTRIGSLTDDILSDARTAARGASGPGARAAAFVLDELNPLSRSWGQRVAEAIEINFRTAVFETRLIEGDSVAEAAEAARRSALDYGKAPEFVRDTIGRAVASAASTYQFASELAKFAAEQPAAARVFYKTVVLKDRMQDPFGIYGNKSTKALGLLTLDDKSFFVPGMSKPLAPLELGLGIAKNANGMLAALARGAASPGGLSPSGVSTSVLESGDVILRNGIDAALPMVQQAILAADEARSGKTTSVDVPRAPAMSDDAAFWSAAVLAHHLDPQREKGIWNSFVRVYQPQFVAPPASYAAYPNAKPEEGRRNYWKRQPPRGTPYLVWGTDQSSGEVVYKVFQPSEAGRLNIDVARKIPLAQVAERLGVGAAITLQSLGEITPTEGFEVVPGRTVPTLSREQPLSSAASLLLGQAPTPAQERQRQAGALAAESAVADKPRTR
jgi:hypothetical protein